MKKPILVSILLLTTLFVNGKTVKVLTIGNSFSEDAVENYLYELAAATNDTILIGNMYIGGATLAQHDANSQGDLSAYSYRKIVDGVNTTTASYKLSNAFKDEEWDYISFQQASPNSGQYNTFFPYITNLITYAKGYATNPNVKFVLHATWAYAQSSTHSGFANYNKDQLTMYNAIINATINVFTDAEMDVLVPTGTAIQNGRTSSLGDSFCRDGHHLELTYGRFTAACTWYETLFGKSAIDNLYIPSTVSEFKASVAKHAAHNAVINPYAFTSLSYMVGDIEEIETVPFTKQINLSFASTPTGTDWNVLAGYLLNDKIDNLKDVDNQFTAVSVMVIDQFRGINTTGPKSTTTDMNLPQGASSQSFFGNVKNWGGAIEPTAALKFSNLDAEAAYDFKIFAGRTGVTDNRETKYVLSGLIQNDTTLYLDASNNTTKTVSATAIRPNALGEIVLDLSPGPNNNNSTGFYYINAMSIAFNTSFLAVERNKVQTLQFFPNPTTDVIHVWAENNTQKISLLNIQGQEISAYYVVQQETYHTISLSHLQPGIYFLSANNQLVKVIKQ